MADPRNTKIQLDLCYDPPKARRSDPRTSKVAAAKVRVGPVRVSILRVMASDRGHRDGWTSLDVAAALDVGRDHVSPHMKPMERMGLIYRTGRERPGKAHGVSSEVWDLTRQGFLCARELGAMSPPAREGKKAREDLCRPETGSSETPYLPIAAVKLMILACLPNNTASDTRSYVNEMTTYLIKAGYLKLGGYALTDKGREAMSHG